MVPYTSSNAPYMVLPRLVAFSSSSVRYLQDCKNEFIEIPYKIILSDAFEFDVKDAVAQKEENGTTTVNINKFKANIRKHILHLKTTPNIGTDLSSRMDTVSTI